MTAVQLNKPAMDAFKARLKAAHVALKNNGPAMLQVAVFLDSWVQRNIKSQGGNVGGWAPFKYGGRIESAKKGSKGSLKKDVTFVTVHAGGTVVSEKDVSFHYKINKSAKLLMDTGALRLSFLPFVRKGVAGIGSDLPYSKTHDEGDDERNIPQRRMLPEDSEVRTQVFEILDNFVVLRTRSLK